VRGCANILPFAKTLPLRRADPAIENENDDDDYKDDFAIPEPSPASALFRWWSQAPANCEWRDPA
jgi:hypothetical protein